jgi:large subunit ribosomal protein L22
MGKRSAVRKLGDKQASAKQKAIRTSPRKLGLVANLIQGMRASDALVQLQFSNKRIAGSIKTVLQAAIANAENNHSLDIDNLVVSEVRVGRAFVMKRFHARARGRAGRIEKPFSHLEIIVTQQEEE